MICEPYICIKGFNYSLGVSNLGDIKWFEDSSPCADYWQPYADFEREKLKELGMHVQFMEYSGYRVMVTAHHEHPEWHSSLGAISYSTADWQKDSESGRLLKRAEFLRAVCEKEGVAWLPEKVTVESRLAKIEKAVDMIRNHLVL